MKSIQVRRLSTGTVFKVRHRGISAPLAAIGMIGCLASGFASLAGYDSVVVNGRSVTGATGFMYAVFAAALIPLIVPLLLIPILLLPTIVVSLGIWMASKYRPMTLEYVPETTARHDLLE